MLLVLAKTVPVFHFWGCLGDAVFSIETSLKYNYFFTFELLDCTFVNIITVTLWAYSATL